MSIFVQRVLPVLAGFALFAACGVASAQVVVHMTTAQGDCLATSSTGVLQLWQATPDLQITGNQTALSGAGCGLAATADPDFSASVSTVAGNPTAGVPFPISWYVTSPTATTQCFYSADPATATASNWPVGAVACTGTSCPTAASPMTQSVTASVASPSGSPYKYAILCTNASGLSQSGGITVIAPTAPTPVFGSAGALTVQPASGLVNSNFQLGWSVTNATICNGVVTAGPTTSLPGWTGQPFTPASGPITTTVTPNVAGTYTLQMQCSNSASPSVIVSSATAQLNVLPSASNCINPAARITTANLTYIPNLGSVPNVNVQEWTNVWGRTKASDPIRAWPGAGVSIPTISWVGADKYISLHFKYLGNLPAVSNGSIQHSTNYAGPSLDATISSTCGDFTNGAASYCKTTDVAAGAIMSIWKVPGGSGNYCLLQPGVDYYMNMRIHNPADAATDLGCTLGTGGVYTCGITIQSTFGIN